MRRFFDGGRKFAQSKLGRTALRQSFHRKTQDLDATLDDDDGRPGAADPQLRHYLFGRQRPWMRIESD
jgi:hypothetical protein